MTLSSRLLKPAAGATTAKNGLVAYWRLDEASGTRVDATGRGNDLTDNNTVTQAAGKVGNAAQFAAANSEYLSLADNADLSMGGDTPFTLAAWCNPATTGGDRGLITKSSNPGVREYQVRMNNTARFQFVASADGAATAVASQNVAWALLTWHLVMAWHDPDLNTINTQIDNGVITSATLAGGVFDDTNTFCIGATNSGASLFWDGLIGPAGVWKRLLTPAERAYIWNSGRGRYLR